MTATLYFNPYSHHSRKVRVLQEELGLKLELESLQVRPHGFGGDNAKPEFLQINPNGKIPVLKEDDFVLWESNSITWYLAEKHGWSALWPQDLRERAAISKWQVWQVAHLSPTLDGFLWENMRGMLGAGEPDAAALAKYHKSLERWSRVLSLQLEGSDYLALDRFTLADIAVSTAMMHSEMAKFSFADAPFVQKWLDRVHERDSWKKTTPPPMSTPGPQ